MILRWVLEALSIYFTTCGALLVFMAHRRTRLPDLNLPLRMDDVQVLQNLAKHHRQLTIALGLLAAALVFQCAVFFFL